MAARKRRIRHDEDTRSKIQASQLINRLTNHVLGKVDMTSTQVTAALGLLKKTLPDLSAAEIKADVNNNYAVADEPLNNDSWMNKHNLSGDPKQGHNTH
jgi:hypothetical protein